MTLPTHWSQWGLCMALLAVGLVHLLPVSGVLGAGRLNALYGVDSADPNLLLLLRHRAVLFGLIGGGLIMAAFVPDLRIFAALVALISMLSFIALAGADRTPQIVRVIQIDWVLTAVLGLALGLRLMFR